MRDDQEMRRPAGGGRPAGGPAAFVAIVVTQSARYGCRSRAALEASGFSSAQLAGEMNPPCRGRR